MKFSLLEKLGASVLICAWLIYGANFIGNALVSPDSHVTTVAVAPETEGTASAAPEPEPEIDLPTLLASADAGAGARVFRKCQACHTVDQGGANRVGPNLWDVVGRTKAAVDGFSYSGALTDMGGDWSYENLDAFLASPRSYAPGNKMTFNGLKKPADRAAVIAYLRSLSDAPKPLP